MSTNKIVSIAILVLLTVGVFSSRCMASKEIKMLPRVNGKINPALLDKEEIAKNTSSQSAVSSQIKSGKTKMSKKVSDSPVKEQTPKLRTGKSVATIMPKVIVGKPEIKNSGFSNLELNIHKNEIQTSKVKFNKNDELADGLKLASTQKKVVISAGSTFKQDTTNGTSAYITNTSNGNNNFVVSNPQSQQSGSMAVMGTPIASSSQKSRKKKVKKIK